MPLKVPGICRLGGKYMLELKDLTKTYKPKKGVPVQALNGINLSFEEKGLVFVLGRSGSGKSTLLNVVGGLDSLDGGEIIIDGKSSKDFKASDYDAYRNTYIGFIFQDYNLLDELTIGENIMLALELQNQKADKERLNSILKEVDLEGYADRKPNELSGGQKQRVAIARALVKNPRIIMADEPTGALDEETGIQVLNTLKKMSQDKLVIVVSHDREFAEQYADRIIRLSDGKVKSDTTLADNLTQQMENVPEKEKAPKSFVTSRLPYRYALRMGASGAWNKPLRLIITILLCMISFAAFGVVDTANSFNYNKVAINGYLDSNYQASAFTAYSTTENFQDRAIDTQGASIKDIERLKDKTGLDYVGVTFTDSKKGSDLLLLSRENIVGKNRSKYYTQTCYGYYPASAELFERMEFALTGEMPKANNEICITQYILEQMNIGGIVLYKYDEDLPDTLNYKTVTLMPDNTRTAKALVEQQFFIKLSNDYWKIVGVIDTNADKAGEFNSLKPSDKYSENKQELLEADCVEYFRYGYHSIGYISKNKYDDIVKAHIADMESWNSFGIPAEGDMDIAQGGYAKSSNFWGVASDKDLNKVNEVIWLDGKERESLKDSEYVIGLNAALRLLQEDSQIESNTYYNHNKIYFDGLISINKMSLDDLYSSLNYSGINCEARYIACFEEAERLESDKLNLFKNYVKERIDAIPDEAKFFNGKEAYVLGLLCNEIRRSGKVNINEELLGEYNITSFKENHWRMLYACYLLRSTDWREKFSLNESLTNWVSWDMSCGYKNNLTGGRTGEDIERIDAKVIYIKGKLKSLQEQKAINTQISYSFNDFEDMGQSKGNLDIVGIYVPQDDFPEENDMDTFVFNNEMFRNISKLETAPYCFLLAPMPKDRAQIEKLVSVHYEDGDRVLKMHNGVVNELDLLKGPLTTMKGIGLILGLGLAVFSTLMIGNYIGASITDKKRDIGILRALGAKANDVYAIFVNESIIIALINALMSIIVTIFACMGLNVLIKDLTQVSLSVLNFGIRQIAIMIIINIAIAVLASLLPIYRMSKKKPIDCIRDR